MSEKLVTANMPSFVCKHKSGGVQVMDFGYPQFTEAKILSEFIKTDAHKMEVTFAHICAAGA